MPVTWKPGDEAICQTPALKGQRVIVRNVMRKLATVSCGDLWFIVPVDDLRVPPVATGKPVPKPVPGKKRVCKKCGKGSCECNQLHYLGAVRAAGMPEPVQEYQFHPDRKWRADFVFPEQMVMVEIDGGSYRSRHRERDGFRADCEKQNTAAIMGYLVLKFDTTMLRTGEAVRVTKDALVARGYRDVST